MPNSLFRTKKISSILNEGSDGAHGTHGLHRVLTVKDLKSDPITIILFLHLNY